MGSKQNSTSFLFWFNDYASWGHFYLKVQNTNAKDFMLYPKFSLVTLKVTLEMVICVQDNMQEGQVLHLGKPFSTRGRVY